VDFGQKCASKLKIECSGSFFFFNDVRQVCVLSVRPFVLESQEGKRRERGGELDGKSKWSLADDAKVRGVREHTEGRDFGGI